MVQSILGHTSASWAVLPNVSKPPLEGTLAGYNVLLNGRLLTGKPETQSRRAGRCLASAASDRRSEGRSTNNRWRAGRPTCQKWRWHPDRLEELWSTLPDQTAYFQLGLWYPTCCHYSGGGCTSPHGQSVPVWIISVRHEHSARRKTSPWKQAKILVTVFEKEKKNISKQKKNQ